VIEILLEAERALTAGRLDEAERLYGQAAAADGRNSIAIVGLARVAVDRGHDRRALDLAHQALSIDSENVAAQRMVARLEEVLGVRGEPVEPRREPASPGAPASPGGRSPEGRRGILARLLRR
jgi:thioredoxin-like negative regulator of GroEL